MHGVVHFLVIWITSLIQAHSQLAEQGTRLYRDCMRKDCGYLSSGLPEDYLEIKEKGGRAVVMIC